MCKYVGVRIQIQPICQRFFLLSLFQTSIQIFKWLLKNNFQEKVFLPSSSIDDNENEIDKIEKKIFYPSFPTHTTTNTTILCMKMSNGTTTTKRMIFYTNNDIDNNKMLGRKILIQRIIHLALSFE